MELSKLREEMDQAKSLVRKHAKEATSGALQRFMADNPMVEKLRWHQYTPYFNDGDPCTFSVREVSILLNAASGAPEVDEDDYELHEWWLSSLKDPSPELKKIQEEFQQLCGELDEDVCLVAFGDHAQITVTRDGVSVDEYSHD